VDYATADIGATAGLDYTATTGTLTIAVGQRSAVIDVPILDDTLIEGNETFALDLSNPSGGASIGTARGLGTIVDDDARFDIATDDTLLAEGDSGPTDYTFTVTRSGDTSTSHAVRWAVTGDGTPGAFANAADFVGGALASGRLVFAGGQTTRTITVQVAGDTVPESREGFAVRLFDASAGAVIGTARAIAAIANDDIHQGGSGGDSLRGGPDGDLLDGGEGNDSLYGGAGNDTILGGDGDDLIEGGAGADSLDGGAGTGDLLSYARTTQGVTIDLAAGTAAGDEAEGDTIAGFEAVRGGTGADRLTGDAGDNTLYGGGGSGVDTLYGGEGNDRLVGGHAPGQANAPDGVNIMFGGDGDDTYHVGPSEDQVIETADGGRDTVVALRSFILPDHVEDLLLLGEGHWEGTGNALANALRGNAGNNLLLGLEGNDNLTGGGGNDTLIGGAGADVFVPGEGQDVIRYLDLTDSPFTARDVIFGFASGEDRLDLAAIGTAIGGWGSERFVSGASFTASHQVAWDAAGRLLRIEADGDLSTVEMAIVFSAGTTILESDIVFG
jgi:Ca2+-binding RTX toxin-like protein